MCERCGAGGDDLYEEFNDGSHVWWRCVKCSKMRMTRVQAGRGKLWRAGGVVEEGLVECSGETETDDYWDGVHVHYVVEGDRIAMDMACGLSLSTYVKPGRSGSTTEERVGYTFDNIPLVTCPVCRPWMEDNLMRCKHCGDLCTYGTCDDCLDRCVCGALLLGTGRFQKLEKHTPSCPGRELAPRRK